MVMELHYLNPLTFNLRDLDFHMPWEEEDSLLLLLLLLQMVYTFVIVAYKNATRG